MKKSLDLQILGLALLAAAAPAQAAKSLPQQKLASHDKEPREFPRRAQKFSATEDDGTAQVIRTNTKVDAEKPREQFLEEVVAEEAPSKAEATEPSEAASDKRVSESESARAEVKAAEHAPAKKIEAAEHAEGVRSDSDDPIKRENAELKQRLAAMEQAAADAKGAEQAVPADPREGEVGVDELTATVAADPSRPTDDESPATVEARLAEKKTVSKQAKKELAHEQSKEARHNEILARASKFDAVPEKYIPDLAQRLKYTNEILKRFGRAYDYRIMTLTEFKKVLADLEATEEKSATRQN